MKSLRFVNITFLIFVTFSILFSFWLMFSTFSYKDGSIIMASKVWSDFAANIPLIRSFSFGSNFPPEYPIFANIPIHYHFLFYFFVGILEKVGLPINFALNIPSALGFFALLILIYLFAKRLFASQKVAILSVIFFLFNGSLSFVFFLKDHSLSKDFLPQLINNEKFSAFGPYDNNIVSAFWNLNIYTNQRHLALSFAISLFIILTVISPFLERHKIKYSLLLGLVLGSFFFFHFAVFLMTVVVLALLFLLLPKSRLSIFIVLGIAALLSLPQYIYLQTGGSNFKLSFVPGYLIFNNLSVGNFISYWFFNLGLHLALIPCGFLLAPAKAKKILLAFIPVFIIGNTLQFSPEMAGNHKFFNYFMLAGSMFSAYFLVYLWNHKQILKPLVLILSFFLIFSGIVDLFPIVNDHKITLKDYPVSEDVNWIKQSTPPDSVFLNSVYIYDSASLAGRKIFLGWPYFAWSAGYDTQKRTDQIKAFFKETDPQKLCQFLIDEKINFISLSEPSEDFPFDPKFWKNNFQPIYYNADNNFTVYNQATICQKQSI